MSTPTSLRYLELQWPGQSAASEPLTARRVWNLDDLDVYYQACVIGGPGAFVIPVTEWDQFARAVRRKLVLEIAGVATPRVVRVNGYDCLIGEKIWEQRRQYWDLP